MCIGVWAWLAACSSAPQVQDSEPQQDTASTKDRKEEKGVETEQEEPFSPLMQAMYSHSNRRYKKLTCLDEAATVEASTTQSLPFYRLDEHAQFLQDVAQLNDQKVMLEVRLSRLCFYDLQSPQWGEQKCPHPQSRPFLMLSTLPGLKWSNVNLEIENLFEYPEKEQSKCVVKEENSFTVLRLILSIELEEIQEPGGTTSLLIHSRAK